MRKDYFESLTKYTRRKSSEVQIGNLSLGGNYPIRVQTMTNTSTSDIPNSVRQIIRSVQAGTEYIRLTVPTRKDVEYISLIVDELAKQGCNVPVIADIHFNARLAKEAASIVDKVRINPGNYLDKKRFDLIDYSDSEYQDELNRIRSEFVELLEICKKYNTAIRIGTNHGSLSDRIMSQYGDTPEGMAESSMEFLRICKEIGFQKVVISMKASNTRIMVYATRLLVAKMKEEGMDYPVHLGVTEAGEGEDGRIKSAVGIGALLNDGIGDTIRVSLTEDPELEIPVAQKLVNHIKNIQNHKEIEALNDYPTDPYSYNRRTTIPVNNIGGDFVPVVIHSLAVPLDSLEKSTPKPDYYFLENQNQIKTLPKELNFILSYTHWINYGEVLSNVFPLLNMSQLNQLNTIPDCLKFLQINTDELNEAAFKKIELLNNTILILESSNLNSFIDQRAAFFRLINKKIQIPVIILKSYIEEVSENLQLKASSDLGGLLLDGLGDGIWIINRGLVAESELVSTSFGILQAARVRVSKTEYISCPSCGRTLFNLQETTKKIREKTAHLKGLKIGIMGCIVNGPGEMADADYGYVGGGKGKITLYKGQKIIKNNVPENLAVDELIALIKQHGDWKEEAS